MRSPAPNFSPPTSLGTFLYRTFFGYQLQLGDPHMGATIATVMFFIILGSGFLLPARHPAAYAPLSVLTAAMRQAPILRTRRASSVHTILGAARRVIAMAAGPPRHHELVQGPQASIFSRADDAARTPIPSDLIGYETGPDRRAISSTTSSTASIVTVGSIFFILLFGAMAAFALTEYRFRGNVFLGLFLALGVMVPIRLGTVAILEIMARSGLVNTLTALILVYTAQGLPLAVFVLSEFMRTVSDDLKNAGPHRRAVGVCRVLPPGPAAGAAGDGDGRDLFHDPGLE